MKKKKLGLGILSWKAHKTLRQTLESYKKEKITELFDDAVIFFGDISNEDRKIAKEYGFRAIGEVNKGIAINTEKLAKNIKADYILIVQNDNPIIERNVFAKKHLNEAIELLNNKTTDFVRMRHRWSIGEGFDDVKKYLKIFPAQEIDPNFSAEKHLLSNPEYNDTWKKKLTRIFRPFKTHKMKGRCIFIEKNPEKCFPKVIQKKGNFIIADSSVINFTDQCFLTTKDFFINTIMNYVNTHPSSRTLNGFQVPEICLNSKWWRKQHFKVAQGTGIFTHGRIDGSFRENHHSQKKDIK